MVIVSKIQTSTVSSLSSSTDMNTIMNDNHTIITHTPPTSSIEYQVQAIVRYRLLFTERPKPVLGTSIGLTKK